MSALKLCPQCGAEYELDQRFCSIDGSTLRAQNATGDLVGAIIADRYHVMKKLGEGGMGTVYLAEHVKMGRKSAVKVMNPGMMNDADAISRFNREAANASRINHPNVASVYDFGETSEGLTYLAMEFIEGPSLTAVIAEHGALAPLRAADITRQAAEALAVAHEMGIVHRDLKPDNIMLARNRDGSDLVKVVDFGIAKAANNEAQKVTKTGLVVGTPEYMSPEQLAGDKLDGRSDTYSLALVAFHMMTGALPFPAETVQESMILRLTDRPRQLREMKDDVAWAPQLQAVFDRALDRSASGRYATSTEFGRELYRAVQAMPAGESAFTSMMTPPDLPVTPIATPEKVVPPTRVNQSTPVAPAPAAVAPAPAKKSRTGLYAMAAVVVVGLGIGGYLMKSTGPAVSLAGGQADAAEPLSREVATSPAPVDMDDVLAQIEKLTDLKTATPADAAAALLRLDSLPASRLTSDQKVFAAILRAEAHATRENEGAACEAVRNVEGASKGTKYEARVKTILDVSCP